MNRPLSEVVEAHFSARIHVAGKQPGGNTFLDRQFVKNYQQFTQGAISRVVDKLIQLPLDEFGRKIFLSGTAKNHEDSASKVRILTVRGLNAYSLRYSTPEEASQELKYESSQLHLFCPEKSALQVYRKDIVPSQDYYLDETRSVVNMQAVHQTTTFSQRYYLNDVRSVLNKLAEWCGDKVGNQHFDAVKKIFATAEQELRAEEKTRTAVVAKMPSRTP